LSTPKIPHYVDGTKSRELLYFFKSIETNAPPEWLAPKFFESESERK
jgi:hypothetical protein